jgi:hypothetical protein
MKKWLALLLAVVMCLSLFACGGEPSDNDEPKTNETETKQENDKTDRPENLPVGEVEVTLDNWQEYFNLSELLEARTNSFDEVENAWVSNHITLKEEYAEYCSDSVIAFEIKQTQPYMCVVEGNVKTGEFQVIKTYTDDEIAARGNEYWQENYAEVTPTGEYNIYKNITDDGLTMGDHYPVDSSLSAEGEKVTFDTFLHKSREVTRVKGTLTFVEKPLEKIDIEDL